MWHHLPLIAVELCISRAIVGDVLSCSVLCGHNNRSKHPDLALFTFPNRGKSDSEGGFSANHDPKQFADANKQVLIKSCISQSELSNYESDTNLLLLEVFGTPSKQCANDTAVIATNDALSITEFAAIGVNSLPQQNALFYVGGYICKKYLAKHSSKQCTALYFVIDML